MLPISDLTTGRDHFGRDQHESTQKKFFFGRNDLVDNKRPKSKKKTAVFLKINYEFCGIIYKIEVFIYNTRSFCCCLTVVTVLSTRRSISYSHFVATSNFVLFAQSLKIQVFFVSVFYYFSIQFFGQIIIFCYIQIHLRFITCDSTCNLTQSCDFVVMLSGL